MILTRNTVNLIRYILENWIPPALRDSFLFYPLLYLVFKRRTPYFAKFRENSPFLNTEEYTQYYQNFPHLMGECDLNSPSLEKITSSVVGSSVLDVGCGRGYLLNSLSKGNINSLTGIDIVVTNLAQKYPHIKFYPGMAEQIPFADRSFDTVICTHTLEHVLNFEKALDELRRVTKRRLIIVVPKEREYLYGFNLHINFFPYLHSFLNRVRPPLGRHTCLDLDGDIFYLEEMIA